MMFVIRLWFWFNFRHMRQHPWRVAAVVMGIGLGAAVFTSVRLAVEASVGSFTASVDVLSGMADWVVVAPGERVPESIVPTLLKMPAVRTASPVITSYVKAASSDGEPFLLIGVDPLLDRPLRSWSIAGVGHSEAASPRMDLLAEPRTVLLSERLSKRLGVGASGRIDLETVQGTKSLRVVGLMPETGLAMAEGGLIALCDIATMQEAMGIRGWVDRVDIQVHPWATKADIRAIRNSLPASCLLKEPGESRESGRRLIRSYQLNLSVLSFVSLFVGMFLVYSLVALNATARRSEVAILRSVGGSPSLVFGLFLAEGVFLGLAGWLLAMPLGAFLVRGLLRAVSATISLLFVRTHAEGVTIAPLEILFSCVITLLVSAMAAVQPALEVRKIPPREAMIMLETSAAEPTGYRLLGLAGIAVVASSWPISLMPPPPGFPLPGYAATFALFLGCSLLSPWILRMLGTVLPPGLRRIGGEPAYLGSRYLRDAGPRIAISAGALITAVGLFVALAVMIHSFRGTVATWVSQSISGDLFLGPRMASINSYRDSLPSELVRMLRREERREPIELVPYRRVPLLYDGMPYQLEALDFERFVKHAHFLMIEGELTKILQALINGQGVLVSEVFANQTRTGVGSVYTARVAGMELSLPILGIFRDYRTHGGVVHYSLAKFAQQTGDEAWSGVRINFAGQPSKRASVVERLRSEIITYCINRGLAVEVTTGGDLRREILRIFDETFGVTTALLMIALVVATIGMATTLSVLVLERTKQIHTLLACGASRAQVRAMIIWEAILMVFGGELMGSVCGFLLSVLLIYVINKQSFGWTFVYGVDWMNLALASPLILGTALLAALPAVHLVFRRSPSMVLRER